MGGGDGVVIIRKAMQVALTDPIVHGKLSPADQAKVDPILGKDVGTWTPEEHETVTKIFAWAGRHAK